LWSYITTTSGIFYFFEFHISRNLLDFASKELESSREESGLRGSGPQSLENRPTSPTSIHPNIGYNIRSDKIEVRESQSAGVFLAGHNLRIPVTTAQEAFRLINRGNKNRATGSTQCNDVSSRSVRHFSDWLNSK
jgi:hypothetical protein